MHDYLNELWVLFQCELLCPGKNEFLCVTSRRFCDEYNDCPDSKADELLEQCKRVSGSGWAGGRRGDVSLGGKYASWVGGRQITLHIYVSLQLSVQNAVSPQPCVGKLPISLVLFNFLDCNFRL